MSQKCRQIKTKSDVVTTYSRCTSVSRNNTPPAATTLFFDARRMEPAHSQFTAHGEGHCQPPAGRKPAETIDATRQLPVSRQDVAVLRNTFDELLKRSFKSSNFFSVRLLGGTSYTFNASVIFGDILILNCFSRQDCDANPGSSKFAIWILTPV